MTDNNSLSFEVDVRAPVDRVWQALIDPDLTQRYYFNTRVESNWKPGSPISYRDAQGHSALDGKIVEFAPPGRLVTTFEPKWMRQDQAGPASTVIWEISSNGKVSKLKLTHKDLDMNNPIVNEIRINLTPEDRARLAKNPAIAPEAYENYLKGRFYWNKRSDENLIKAIGYFEQATHQDPYYALAYAGLSDCYAIIGATIFGTMPVDEAAPKARDAARRAGRSRPGHAR